MKMSNDFSVALNRSGQTNTNALYLKLRGTGCSRVNTTFTKLKILDFGQKVV